MRISNLIFILIEISSQKKNILICQRAPWRTASHYDAFKSAVLGR